MEKIYKDIILTMNQQTANQKPIKFRRYFFWILVFKIYDFMIFFEGDKKLVENTKHCIINICIC